MFAAVVSAFGSPPHYADIAVPQIKSDREVLIDVIAAGLHPRVRSQAGGTHYTSTDELPLIPGIDGVGRTTDGVLRYFLLPDTTMGSMAERTVIDLRRSIVLDQSSDPVLIAAGMNPAMSSWVALRRRIEFRSGSSILVLGATGSAGRVALSVARHLGAGRVIAAGRNPDRLAELPSIGADDVVSFEDPDALGAAAADVDVVLDYLWGAPTEAAMTAVITHRRDRARPLVWVQIGSVAGPVASIPSAALRAARLQIVGSGQGSVPTEDILAELPELARLISRGDLPLRTRTVPLADVERVWNEPLGAERLVITPK